ncbi:MAG: hypothetical protein A3E78_00920 [Alphaproteobacteria bacterium RIFCSPHIGHO2_12_FULL_63_12]|nr:MAG: hypothetical protein A3E78_00920 [Alphaproteobacteria bacterium RIFCSPHIGHO2_12_FULL_63_12]
MKTIMMAACAALALSSCGGRKTEAPPADAPAALKAIADDYLAAELKVYPFAVVYAGVGDVVNEDYAAMEDNSPETLARLQRIEDELYARLMKLGAAGFAGADWVLYETLKESLEAGKDVRVCQQPLWSVNHMSGWQNSFPQVAAAQPVDTAVKRGLALARWRQFPGYLEQDIENLRAGLAAGYSVPKRVVARVIAQLDAIIAAPAQESPFLSFAATAQDDDKFSAAIKKLAEEEIAPAILAYRDFLRDEYMPKARDALSISAIPDGAACYEALLRQYHTASIGGKATFERGRATVSANTTAVIARGEAMFGESDFGAILQRVKDAPGNRFASEGDLVAFTRAFVPTTREKVAPFFSKLPAQELAVEPFPDFLKGTGQSSRYETTPASEGAATYRINTDEWATQTKGEAEIVAVHEGWPGHHLQIATAYAVEGLHPVTRLIGSTAFIEGWARYAEGLAEEAGLYANGYGEITRRAWPARGMVVDPGMHLYGWTNEQAAAFLIASGRFDQNSVDTALDRIAVIPGQLTAYDTGGLEIAALRGEALKRLGARFDIQAFHDRVLENGAVPLAALRQHVEEWIAAEEAKG